MVPRLKSIKAVAAGHICLDICHTSFEASEEIVDFIQPAMRYSSAVNLDVITNPLTPEKASRVQQFLEEASRVEGGLSTGGGVSNTGIPLYHMMPSSVKLISKVGDDIFSQAIDKVLSKQKFLGSNVKSVLALKRVPGETTSYTIVMNPSNGLPTFYAHYPGTNDTFTADDIDFDLVSQAEGLEFSYPTLMKKCYENTTNLRDMFKPISELETKVFVDMHTLEEGKPSGKAPWNDILGNALPYVHRFMPSLPEALFIYDKTIYNQVYDEAKETKKEFLDIIRKENPGLLRKIGEHFLFMGASGIVIKCGKSGAYLLTGTNNNLEWRGKEIFVNTYKEKRFVDSRGAGDNSVAAYMAAELNGLNPVTSMKYLVAGGTLNVEHEGPVGAFNSLEDLEKVTHRATIPFDPGAEFEEKSDYFTGSNDAVSSTST